MSWALERPPPDRSVHESNDVQATIVHTPSDSWVQQLTSRPAWIRWQANKPNNGGPLGKSSKEMRIREVELIFGMMLIWNQ